MESHARILVVEDDDQVRGFLGTLLEDQGYEVTGAANGLEAVDQLARKRFALVVTDVDMPALSGLDLVKRMRELTPGTPAIVLSADAERRSDALAAGAVAFLEKPVKIGTLLGVIRQSIEEP
jgi:CheY-like chemotaxis protein